MSSKKGDDITTGKISDKNPNKSQTEDADGYSDSSVSDSNSSKKLAASKDVSTDDNMRQAMRDSIDAATDKTREHERDKITDIKKADAETKSPHVASTHGEDISKDKENVSNSSNKIENKDNGSSSKKSTGSSSSGTSSGTSSDSSEDDGPTKEPTFADMEVGQGPSKENVVAH